MNYIVNFFTLTVLVKVFLCVELFNESAWMDEKGRDKYFEYTDLTEPAKDDIELRVKSNYSNNIDFEQFEESKNQKRQEQQQHSTGRVHIKNQGTYSPLNVIDLFLNTIKKVVSPQKQLPSAQRTRHNKNETSKGIDIKIENNVHSLPAFGNHQDMKFIFLGTKWCGSGDIASNRNDIGYFYMTDNCCREHDLCEKVIEPSSESFGLKNSGKFTRLHCDCDDQFYKCLKSVNSLVSKQIGIFYFNVLGHQCFREDYPIIACSASVKGRCVKWTKNESGSKIFQWFDNRWF